MGDDMRNTALLLRVIWVISLVLLLVVASLYTYQWNPDTPFITLALVQACFLAALMLGLYASISGWLQATVEKIPQQKLSLLQILGWSIGHVAYILLVVVFYEGVLMGLLFALDSTLHRYAAIDGPQTIIPNIYAKYLFLITFSVIAVGQTSFVGTSMARSFVTLLDKRLGLE